MMLFHKPDIEYARNKLYQKWFTVTVGKIPEINKRTEFVNTFNCPVVRRLVIQLQTN